MMSFDNMAPVADLSHIGVLVTRASHQAGSLCQQIAKLGGRPLRLPAVIISGPKDMATAQRCMTQAADYDFLVFVSRNAVMYGLKLTPEGQLPESPALVAVGRGTAEMLAKAGYPVDVVPQDRFDSEALLETPELQNVSGRKVLIVRGNGGRGLLGEVLAERGAQVDYAEVYTRECPKEDDAVQSLLLRWKDDIDIVTVTSIDIMDNLFTMLGEPGEALLQQTPLVVISDRMRQQARKRGCQHVILAQGAEDRLLIQAISQWAMNRG